MPRSAVPFGVDDPEEEDWNQSNALPLEAQDRASQRMDSPEHQLPAAESDPPPGPTPDLGGSPFASALADYQPQENAPEAPRLKGIENPELGTAIQNFEQPTQQMAPPRAGYEDAWIHEQDRLNREGVSQKAGASRYLRAQGVELETLPDGSQVIASHADGSPRFKSANSTPFQDENKNWLVRSRSDRGELADVPIQDTKGIVHVNRETGDQYFVGADKQPVIVGQDQRTLDALDMRAKRAEFEGKIATRSALLGELQNGLSQSLRLYGGLLSGGAEDGSARTVRQLQNAVDNVRPMIEAGTAEPDQVEKFNEDSAALDKYKLAHPEYQQTGDAISATRQKMAQMQHANHQDSVRRRLLGASPDVSAAVASLLPSGFLDDAQDRPFRDASLAAVDEDTAALAAQARTGQSKALPAVLEKLKASGITSIGGKPIDEVIAAAKNPPPLPEPEATPEPQPERPGWFSNFVGSALSRIKTSALTVEESLMRGGLGGASVTPAAALALAVMPDSLRQKINAGADELAKWRQQLQGVESGDVKAEDANAPGILKAGTGLLNPERKDSWEAGLGHILPDLALMFGLPEAALPVFVSRGFSEGQIQASDKNRELIAQGNAPTESETWGALAGGGKTALTLAAFHGAGKLASKILPMIAEPSTRFLTRLISGTAIAGTLNAAVDVTVNSLFGGKAIPQTPAEWVERGLFALGFGALHGWHEAKLPDRLNAAINQLRIIEEAKAAGAAPATVAMAEAHAEQLGKFLGQHQKLVEKLVKEQKPGTSANSTNSAPGREPPEARAAGAPSTKTPPTPGGVPPAKDFEQLRGETQPLIDRIQELKEFGGPEGLIEKKQVEDALDANQQALTAHAQTATDEVPPELRERIARAVSPDTGLAQSEAHFAENPEARFMAAEVGRNLRGVYLDEAQQRGIEEVRKAAGQHAPTADFVADQHVGLLAGRDLANVLTGGDIGESKARALADLGILHAPEDGGPAQVTDDALKLIPPALRTDPRVADRFKLTPGGAQDGAALLVRGGQDYLADVLRQRKAARDTSVSSMVAQNSANVLKATAKMRVGDESLHEWGRRQIAKNPSKTAFAVALQKVALTNEAKATPSQVRVHFTDKSGQEREAVIPAEGNEEQAKATAESRIEKSGNKVLGSEVLQDVPQKPIEATSQSKEVKPTPSGEQNEEPVSPDTKFSPKANEPAKGQPLTWDDAKLTDFTPDGQAAIKAVEKEFQRNAPLFRALGVKGFQPSKFHQETGGVAMGADGVLRADGAQLAEHFATLSREGVKPDEWARRALQEEAVHLAQFKAAGPDWKAYYEKVWADVPAEMREEAAKAYQNFDGLGDAEKAAEVVRMVIQGRWKGGITESVRAAIKQVVDYLRGFDLAKAPLVKEAVERAEAVLGKASAEAEAAAKSERARITAQRRQDQEAREAELWKALAQSEGQSLKKQEEAPKVTTAAGQAAEREIGDAALNLIRAGSSGTAFESGMRKSGTVEPLYREGSRESSIYTTDQSGLSDVVVSVRVEMGGKSYLLPRPQKDGNFSDTQGFESDVGPAGRMASELQSITPALLEKEGKEWKVVKPGKLTFASKGEREAGAPPESKALDDDLRKAFGDLLAASAPRPEDEPAAFDEQVKIAANTVHHTDKFGDRKAWIEPVWRQWQFVSNEEMPLDEFKTRLLAELRAGRIGLTRNDFQAHFMAKGEERERLKAVRQASEMTDPRSGGPLSQGETFHFVTIEPPGGLASSAPTVKQSEIPEQHMDTFMGLARRLAKEARTPEAFARRLAAAVGDKAESYSEAIWDLMGVADKTLRGTHDWARIHAGGVLVPESPTETSVVGGTAVELPVKDLSLSSDVPNFKAGANAKGLTEPLTGRFDARGVGPVQVWERTDGRREVISGRHRLDLAQREGRESILAQIHREADGFTAADAATLDAELNIRDGQGSVADYATYFRAAEISRDEAERRGLLGRAKGRSGFVVGDEGSPDLFALHQSGKISDAQAEAVAAAAPGEAEFQRLGIRAALDGKPASDLRKIIGAFKARAGQSEKQLDLLGADDSVMAEMEQGAKIASAAQRDLRTQIQSVEGAAKNPESAKKLGVDANDPAGILREVADLRGEIDRWERYWEHPELLAQVNEGGLAASKAKNAKLDEESGGLFDKPPPAKTQTPKASLPPEMAKPELLDSATKTPEEIAAEKSDTQAKLEAAQRQQDVRVGAAKPLQAGEDIRPERDMFGADKVEGDDLFDKSGLAASKAGTSNLTASAEKNVRDAKMMRPEDPAGFLREMVARARARGDEETAANLERAVAGIDAVRKDSTPAGKIQSAYRDLASESKFPSVRIADLAKRSGLPLEQVKEHLHQQWRAGKVQLEQGDWSLSSEDTRKGAITVNGDKMLMARFTEPGGLAASKVPERTYDAIQREIDTEQDRLEAQHVDVIHLYDASQPGADALDGHENWKPMPDKLAKLYRERDAEYRRETASQMEELSGAIKGAGASEKAAKSILSELGFRGDNAYLDGNAVRAMKRVDGPLIGRVYHTLLENLDTGGGRFHFNLVDEKGRPDSNGEPALVFTPDFPSEGGRLDIPAAKKAIRIINAIRDRVAPSERRLNPNVFDSIEVPGSPPRLTAGEQQGGLASSAASAAPKQTETPEFKRWFGKSSVTASGKPGDTPKVMFHGSNTRGIRIFNVAKDGVFFTDEPKVSREYAHQTQKPFKSGALYPVFLRMEKPLDLRARGYGAERFRNEVRNLAEFLKSRGWPEDKIPDAADEHAEDPMVAWGLRSDGVVEAIKSAGYDGVIFSDHGTPLRGEVEYNVWAIFDSSQVKAATGNSGAFDSGNPSILAASAPTRGAEEEVRRSGPVSAVIRAATPGLDIGRDVKQGIQSLLLPSAKGPENLAAAEVLGSKLGRMNQRAEGSNDLTAKDHRAFVKLGVDREGLPIDRNAGIKFMSDASTGRPVAPEFRGYQEIRDRQYAARIGYMEAAGAPLQSVRENYFPGIWTGASRRAFNLAMEEARERGIIPEGTGVNDATEEQMAWVKARVDAALKNGQGSDKDALGFLTKRPFKGKEGFRKQKVFDQDIATAFKFGLKAASNNPVDIDRLKWAEMDRSIMANEALAEWAKDGKLKFLKMGDKVPDGWQKVDDRYGNVWGPREIDVTARNSRLVDSDGLPVSLEEAGLDALPPEGTRLKARLFGRLQIGNRIVPNPVGDVLNNYLSSSLYNNPYFGKLYKGWMGFANVLNQTQLGVGSAFHAGFTTMEAQISAGANLLKDAFGLARGNRSIGQVLGSVKNLGTATGETAFTGDKVLNAWRERGGTINPRIRQVVEAAELAGGGFTMERGLQTDQTSKLVSDWYNGHEVRAAMRSPVAGLELLARPIMSWLVPRQKAGVFAHLAWRIIEQNPGVAMEDLRPQFRQAWNRVDARLGQVRYDRLFINNTAKNVIQGLVRAPGWSGGTIAELGGAFKDTFGFFHEWQRTGKLPADVPDRVAYTASLLLTVGLANAALTYAFTGQQPEGLDYWAFRTGGKDEHGNPERFILPTYMKDLLAYAKEPLTTLVNKAHPTLSLFGDLWRNKDYYGVEVRHEDDGAVKQVLQSGKYIAKAFVPFWIRGQQREAELHAGALRQILPLAGVMPAPKKMTQTPAERLADEYAKASLPAGGRTQAQADASRVRYQLAEAIRRGEHPDFGPAIKAGHLKRYQIATLRANAKLTPLQAQVKRLSIDKADAVFNAASAKERGELGRIMREKRANAAARK